MDADVSRIGQDQYHRPTNTSAVSPFRYPGGKGFLAPFLARHVASLGRPMERFAEPFAGGAGSALRLLKNNTVASIVLNDLDVRVFSAWKAILSENERFLERLSQCTPDIETWRDCRELVEDPHVEYNFEVGFATYFINRTSRAGIIIGSGPIGGYDQKGKWLIDARFYKDTMRERISWLGQNADRIELSNRDALSFLDWSTKRFDSNETFYFIDPPYVAAGSRLYFNAMKEGDHVALADYLKSDKLKHWLLTYDSADLISALYEEAAPCELEVPYSLGKIRKERETLVASDPVRL